MSTTRALALGFGSGVLFAAIGYIVASVLDSGRRR